MTKILVLPNGPIAISNEGSSVVLCRCGQTSNPLGLCDGTHAKWGFEAKAGEVKLGERVTLEVVDDT